jgi:hypothetical protein
VCHDLWVGGSRQGGGPERLPTGRSRALNRTQRLVLWFFVLAWASLATILALSPSVRDLTLSKSPASGAAVVPVFLIGLLGFLVALGTGVVRKWRWLFWLLLLAFGVGLIRMPLAVLQLTGSSPSEGPDWYLVLQGVSGLAQAGIALAMWIGYRRDGPWGPF